MKVKKSVYLVDKFVDYTGAERPVTMCASSLEPDEEVFVIGYDWSLSQAKKILSLGIAVGHINDKNCWNEEIGKKIALGRSLKIGVNSPILVTTEKGFISAELVDAFLKKEMEHFKKDPGTYITGYDKAKQRYQCQKKAEQS